MRGAGSFTAGYMGTSAKRKPAGPRPGAACAAGVARVAASRFSRQAAHSPVAPTVPPHAQRAGGVKDAVLFVRRSCMRPPFESGQYVVERRGVLRVERIAEAGENRNRSPFVAQRPGAL